MPCALVLRAPRGLCKSTTSMWCGRKYQAEAELQGRSLFDGGTDRGGWAVGSRQRREWCWESGRSRGHLRGRPDESVSGMGGVVAGGEWFKGGVVCMLRESVHCVARLRVFGVLFADRSMIAMTAVCLGARVVRRVFVGDQDRGKCR